MVWSLRQLHPQRARLSDVKLETLVKCTSCTAIGRLQREMCTHVQRTHMNRFLSLCQETNFCSLSQFASNKSCTN